MAFARRQGRSTEMQNASLASVGTACWTVVVIGLLGVFETALAAKFKTYRLSKDDITVAEYYATELWTEKFAPYWWNSMTPDPIPAMTWYRKIMLGNEPRYEALALLLITKPVETKIKGSDLVNLSFKESWRCTAFYIAPDTLMTVAHCLTDSGVTAGSDYFIYARQNFVGERDQKYTKELAKQYERVVVEWIYEEAFSKTTPLWSSEEAADYAFLKIKGSSHNNAFYTLATPKGIGADKYDYIGTHASVLIAGYPGHWSKFKDPAEVEGVLHYTTDAEFKNEPGIALEIEKFGKERDPAMLSKNQIAAVSHTKGTIGHGGSGGPWLISEKSLTTQDKTARSKWVIGMSLWSTKIPTEKQMPGKSFAERQKLSTVAVSKLFTDAFVAMAKDIAAAKNGAKTMQSVMEEHIKK